MELLRKGGSLVIYPEGAWNLTANLPVMKLYTGTVEMAIETGATIIPIAIDFRGSTYYVNIGKNLDCQGWQLERKREHTEYLCDVLATLKWEIWEQAGQASRRELDGMTYRQFIEERMAWQPDDDSAVLFEEFDLTRYHDRCITDEAEVFAFLDDLEIDQRNAFLAKVRENFPRKEQKT